jgi:leucyl aminopeptidase
VTLAPLALAREGRSSMVAPPTVTSSEAAASLVPDAEVVAVPVLSGVDGPVLGPGAADLAETLGIDLLAVLESAQATGCAGEVTALPLAALIESAADLRLVLLVGVGTATAAECRTAGAALARAVRHRGVVATTLNRIGPADLLGPLVAGLVLGSFGYLLSRGGDQYPPAERFVFAEFSADDAADLDRAIAIAAASWESRTLAATPANVANPAWLADWAVAAGKAGGLTITVWDEARLAAEGFGGILGIGQASDQPSRLIRLDYTPPKSRGAKPRKATASGSIVLVGKGVTFDSGGLSIKPGEAMSNMKRDMTGAGTVIAVLGALAAVGCPVPVIGLVPAVENAISGGALRPGDVVTHYGGRTTEVTNTDAEGRVILADALAYAIAELSPAAVVDIATLTGAVKVALGQQVGGLFANHDALASALTRAGDAAGEPLWRLPLASVYEDKIASRVADADNAGGGPGAITAALFLQHFAAGAPWAHLDIASVGDAPADRDEWTQGPTGFGVRLLLEWLSSPDPLDGVADRTRRSSR